MVTQISLNIQKIPYQDKYAEFRCKADKVSIDLFIVDSFDSVLDLQRFVVGRARV